MTFITQCGIEELQRLLEIIPESTFVVNRQGKILLANQQAGDLFGHSQEELLGAPIEMLLPDTTLKNVHSKH